MREFKMRRGEHLDERLPDLEATVEERFGPITDTETYEGSDLFVVEEPDNPVFERVVAGGVEYSGKKTTLAVDFTERPVAEVIEHENADVVMEDAREAKNQFLIDATGRDAKSRRESMKRDVEDDDTPEGVE